MVFLIQQKKNEKNIKLHKIDLVAASQVFYGYHIVFQPCNTREPYTLIGLLEGIEVVVVFLKNGQNITTLSARRALSNERRRFWAAYRKQR